MYNHFKIFSTKVVNLINSNATVAYVLTKIVDVMVKMIVMETKASKILAMRSFVTVST